MSYAGDASEELAKLIMSRAVHKGFGKLAYIKFKVYSRYAQA